MEQMTQVVCHNLYATTCVSLLAYDIYFGVDLESSCHNLCDEISKCLKQGLLFVCRYEKGSACQPFIKAGGEKRGGCTVF